MWRSPVAHLLWEQGAGGSNPLTPTISLPRSTVTGVSQVLAAVALALALAGCSIIPLYTRANQRLTDDAKPTRATRDIAVRELPNGVFVGVAISGGGSRAANFSTAILFELEELGFLRTVFGDLVGLGRFPHGGLLRAVRSRFRAMEAGACAGALPKGFPDSVDLPLVPPPQHAAVLAHRLRPERHHEGSLRRHPVREEDVRRHAGGGPEDPHQRHEPHDRASVSVHRPGLQNAAVPPRHLSDLPCGDGLGRLSWSVQQCDPPELFDAVRQAALHPSLRRWPRR